MATKVKETIKKLKLIEPGDKLVLGVSGGPDSIAMLNILYEICQSNPEPMATKSQEVANQTRNRWQVGSCPHKPSNSRRS